MKKRYLILLSLAFSCSNTFAYEVNFKSGSIGYELYDLFWVKGVNGAGGWVAVAAFVIGGIYMATKGAAARAMILVAAGFMIKRVDSMLESFGATLEGCGSILESGIAAAEHAPEVAAAIDSVSKLIC